MRDYRSHIGRLVIVQLSVGDAISGTLARAGADVLELHDAAYLAAAGSAEPKPIDGTVLIDRLSITWVQVP